MPEKFRMSSCVEHPNRKTVKKKWFKNINGLVQSAFMIVVTVHKRAFTLTDLKKHKMDILS